MYASRAKAEADAQFYIANKELETVKQRLTKEYLILEATQALTTNLKLYVGDQIPDYVSLDGNGISAASIRMQQ